MADSTKPNLTAVATPALTDIVSCRQSGDTRDKKQTTAQLLSHAIPASSTDNAVVRRDGTAGKTQDSGWTIDDSDNLAANGSVLLKVAGATKIYLHASAAVKFANDSGIEWSSTSAAGDNHSVGLSFQAAGVAQVDGPVKGDGLGALFAKWWASKVGANVASAGTITPTAHIFHVTGTTTVSTINLPYTGFTGSILIIPDGIFLTDVLGNIGLASTSVVGKAILMTYDGTKWWPSY